MTDTQISTINNQQLLKLGNLILLSGLLYETKMMDNTGNWKHHLIWSNLYL